MVLGPTLFIDREGRMSGRRVGCSGAREGPDVQSEGPDVRAGEIAVLCSRCAAPVVRSEGPYVQCFGRCRMSGVMAGCPGHRGSLLCSLDGLSICPRWGSDF